GKYLHDLFYTGKLNNCSSFPQSVSWSVFAKIKADIPAMHKKTLFRMLKRHSIFSLLLVMISLSAYAQTGTIKGFVYEKSTGEPMIYTTVFLEGTSIGVQTDLNGYFSIR